MSAKVYEIVTDKIIEALDKGTVPWRKPWVGGNCPASYTSGKAYRGINVWLLAFSPYEDHRWITLKQVNAQGGRIKKGEKSRLVVFWSPIKKTEFVDGAAVEKKFFLLRYYNVFNVEQTEGWEPKPLPTGNDNQRNQTCDGFLAALPEQPKVIVAQDKAYYSPATDDIGMPPLKDFVGSAEYYSTLFHEVTHWTGAESRLKRFVKGESTLFGSEAYSKEELVAEMGAAYCCGLCGIENSTLQNSAAYIQSWMKRLKADPKLVVQAAAQAQRAVDWMTGVKFDNPSTDEAEPKTEELAAAE
jgi:antirestriction protein ArdC